MEAADTAYDAVPYPPGCWPQTHPDRLATLATLFGMKPAPVQKCRTLEVGCGDGWNLITLAHAHRDAKFVGIDLAPTAIAKATSDAKSLGLTNVEFHAADFLNWSPPGGQFDYIIAHGFFSWVPEPVRVRLLELCRERLADHGVAYVSYNALPGCHIRAILRDMMRFHVRDIKESKAKVAKAREFLQLLIAGRATESKLSELLREEAQKALDRHESVLFHDDLATINQPYYFHEFAGLAANYGLQFLAEASFVDMQDSAYPPAVVTELRRFDDDIVRKEQYLDFLKCRRFRQTLLCRDDVKLDRTPAAETVRQFFIASQAKPKSSQPNMAAGVPEDFSTSKTSARVGDPLAKAALVELAAYWPRAYSFEELLTAAHRRLGWPMNETKNREGQLAQIIFGGFSSGLVELQMQQPTWDVKTGKRPLLGPLVRFQLMNNQQLVTSLRGTATRVDSMLRAVYLLMDGTRNIPAIATELRRLAPSQGLTLPEAADQLRSDVGRIVREAAKGGMLIAWDDSPT